MATGYWLLATGYRPNLLDLLRSIIGQVIHRRDVVPGALLAAVLPAAFALIAEDFVAVDLLDPLDLLFCGLALVHEGREFTIRAMVKLALRNPIMSTILIVDDNPLFLTQAVRLCEREGFSTLTAGTWSELNTILSGHVPDLVLLDIELPSIPGHRLGAFIRARHQIPIVLISALDEERLRKLFAASDADAWICKPLTRDKLIAAVTRFLPQQADGKAAATEPERVNATPELHRVLLIEDDPVITARIESALKAECEVTTAEDGESAIGHLWSDSFDCILLDLMLPRLSGFDVVRHLMMRRPELLKATVIMTASSDESLQFIDPDSVARVLKKPFEIGSLPAIVAEVSAALKQRT
jgi:DNA-binding response OmpR family regulator